MRCTQCGERAETMSVGSVAGGSPQQEHLCWACAAIRFATPAFDDLPVATAFRSRPRAPRVRVQPGDRATLWRGAQLLGVIDVVTPPESGWLIGLLVPAEGHPPLTNIDQGSDGRRGRRGLVVQSEMAADATPWLAPQPRDGMDRPGIVTLSLPRSRPAYVRPDRWLEVRDGDGHELATSSILLTELRLIEGMSEPFRSRAPEAAVHRTPTPGAPDRERLWYVLAEFETEQRAH